MTVRNNKRNLIIAGKGHIADDFIRHNRLDPNPHINLYIHSGYQLQGLNPETNRIILTNLYYENKAFLSDEYRYITELRNIEVVTKYY